MGLETRNLNTTAIKQGYNSAYKVISNWVPTNDGRYMCCWMDSSTKELQTGFSADLDFLSVDFAMESVVVTSGITVDGYSRNQTSLFKRTDGKVLLFIVNKNLTAWVKCFISATGNGDDWTYYSTLRTIQSYTSNGGTAVSASVPIQLDSGRLVMSTMDGFYYSGGYCFPGSHVYISDDNGATWTTTLSMENLGGGHAGASNVCSLPDGSLFIIRVYGSGSTVMYKSLNGGSTWSNVSVDFSDDFSDQVLQNCFFFSFFYDSYTGCIFAICNGSPTGLFVNTDPTAAGFLDKANWTLIYDMSDGGSYEEWPKTYLVGTTLVFYNPYSGNAHLWSDGYTPPPGGSCAMFYKSATGWKRVRAGIKI